MKIIKVNEDGQEKEYEFPLTGSVGDLASELEEADWMLTIFVKPAHLELKMTDNEGDLVSESTVPRGKSPVGEVDRMVREAHRLWAEES